MTDRDQLLRSTVNEVIALHPATIHVLNAWGVDTCCGGGDTLEEAARLARVKPGLLLSAIEEAVRT